MMAEVSITAKGGDLVLSTRTGMRPLLGLMSQSELNNE